MARSSKNDVRVRIHERIRHRVHGTRGAASPGGVSQSKAYLRPGDRRQQGHTLAAASSGEKKAPVPSGGNLAGAKEIGKLIAERAKAKGVTKVVFDRGGYLYHGRIKALADAARAAGLEF